MENEFSWGKWTAKKTALYDEMPWHQREQMRHELHYVIYNLLDKGTKAASWQKLLLEWPHKSLTDAKRIAYTVDEKKGEADIQTVTSLGKYLRRHFPDIPDHELRDIVSATGTHFKFINTVEEIIEAVDEGPSSCMCRRYHDSDNEGKRPPWGDTHPYSVYLPEYGWHMAIRVEAGEIRGRCLCNGKIFVRSYFDEGTENSPADHGLEKWLIEQGYTKHKQWPEGLRLAKIENEMRGGPLLPYLDGKRDEGARNYAVRTYDDKSWEIISNCNRYEYECSHTNGTGEEGSGYDDEVETYYCEECDNDSDEELVRVGRYRQHTWVCVDCRDNHYTWAYSRNGDRAYVPDSEVVEVEGRDYDEQYLSDNDIIYLDSTGEYISSQYAVEINGLYYDNRAPEVVKLTADFYSSETYALREDVINIAENEDDEPIWVLEEDTVVVWNYKLNKEVILHLHMDELAIIDNQYYHVTHPAISMVNGEWVYNRGLELEVA